MRQDLVASSAGQRCVCSWSGGKDCALALYRVMRAGARPVSLLTACIEDGSRTRSHGLRREVIEAQSVALGLPLRTFATSWTDYEQNFVRELQAACADADAAIFGDIDGENNRMWEEKVSSAAGVEALLPVWHEEPESLIREFVRCGFAAMIVAVDDQRLPAELLGETLSISLIDKLIELGADPCGELGEYHTVVFKGPLFSREIRLRPGIDVLRAGYRFLDVELA